MKILNRYQSFIKNKVEHDLVGALVKFHRRSFERLTTKFRKLEQANTREINVIKLSKNVESMAMDSKHLKRVM